MDQTEIKQLWTFLEATQELQPRLEALSNLELLLSPHDELSIKRLKKLTLFAVGPFKDALQHLAIRIRRRSFLSETFSSSATLDDFRNTGQADLAKEALRDPSAVARYDFLQKLERDDLFEVAPVLGNQMLREKDPKMLAILARILGRLGSERHILSLKRASRHEDQRVRLGALEGLAFQSGQERNQILVERLGDSERAVYVRARHILASTSVQKILDVVERIPSGRMPLVLRRVVPLLEQDIGSRRVRHHLQHLLADPDPQVSSAALLALARVGDPKAEAQISILENSPDPRVQQVLQLARSALAGGNLGVRGEGG
jgi:hypothetical protein